MQIFLLNLSELRKSLKKYFANSENVRIFAAQIERKRYASKVEGAASKD